MAACTVRFMVQVSIIVAILMLTAKTVNGIHCFQCNSARDAGCENLIDNSTDNVYYKLCEPERSHNRTFFCRTITQIIKDRGNLVRVIRSCGWQKYHNDCYDYEDEDHAEHVCQCFTDGCNSRASDVLRPSLLFVAMCLPLLTILRVY